MEPKDFEFTLPTPMENEVGNKSEEPEMIQNSDSKKGKMSLSSDDSLNNESSPRVPGPVVEKSKKKSFSCKYCDKKFSNSQALGGHQNAHKEVRALAKGKKSINVDQFGFGPSNFHPHPNMGYYPPYYHHPMIPMERFFSPMVPSVPEPYYRQTNFVPNILDPLRWDSPSVNPPMPNAISQRIPIPNSYETPINVILRESNKVCAENGKDQEPSAGNSNRGAVINFVGDSNGIVNNQENSKDWDESMDLTLKL